MSGQTLHSAARFAAARRQRAVRNRRPKQQKFKKRDVHGWIVLDKPIGMTSTHAVAVIKRLFSAKRAGHAGTLDPLASGCLPIALGEATKTVPFVVDSRKTYLFTVRWGEERDTDDAEGRVVADERKPARCGGDPGRAAALHRHDRAGAAALFGGQNRWRAGLRSGARRRNRRACRRGPCRSIAWNSSKRPTPTMPCLRPNAAKAPMSARWRAISAGCWAYSAMSRRCAAAGSGRSAKRT